MTMMMLEMPAHSECLVAGLSRWGIHSHFRRYLPSLPPLTTHSTSTQRSLTLDNFRNPPSSTMATTTSSLQLPSQGSSNTGYTAEASALRKYRGKPPHLPLTISLADSLE